MVLIILTPLLLLYRKDNIHLIFLTQIPDIEKLAVTNQHNALVLCLLISVNIYE